MSNFGVRLPRRPREPQLDPAGGDPALARLRSAVSEQDVQAVVAALRGFAEQDLSALVRGIASLPDIDEALPALAAAAPDDPLPRLLLGSRTINRAWAVRTGARASQVSGEQLARFHALLEEAEEHLYAAARMDHASAAPWYFLLVSGRGLEIGPDASRRRFEAVISREPEHFAAHRQRLQQLCRKWGGSHQEMHEFARQAMLNSADPQLAVLVAEAHIEQWSDLRGGAAGKAYLRETAVGQALLEAAARSIDQPGFAPARDPYLGYNMFAFAFSLAGLLQAARRAFWKTRGVVTSSPWEHLAGQPLDNYLRWRATSAKSA
jgi:hypothetical protein